MEAGADGVDERARAGCLPQACFQTTLARGGGLKRTKLFFGARCAPGDLHMEACPPNSTMLAPWHACLLQVSVQVLGGIARRAPCKMAVCACRSLDARADVRA